MNKLKLILAVSVFLLIIPLAFAAHSAIVSVDDTAVWEIINNDFKLTVENDFFSNSSINNITVTLPNFTVKSVVPKSNWTVTYTTDQINWYTTTAAISNGDISNFWFTLEASEVDENITSDWTIETVDLDLGTDTNNLQVTIRNDSITPDVDDISPSNFAYVPNTTINFLIDILENETGIQSSANLGYRDDVGVTLTGNVTASIPLTCDSGTNQCTGSLDPNSGMNLPGNPFLDFRIIDLEDNASNVYDVFPNLIHHYYVDYQAPIIELQAPPDQIQIPGSSYDFVFNMTDDSFKTDSDSNWLGASPAINCTLLINGVNYGSSSPTYDGINTTITANLTGLGDGTHPWQVKCIDDAGWSGLSAMRYFLRDISPPTVSLEWPSGSNNILPDSINFTWIATDLMDDELLCNLTINGIVNESNIPSLNNSITSKEINGFTEGDYYWNAVCWDDNGNNGTAPTDELFTVDMTAPTVSIIGPTNNSIITNETIDFEFIPDDNLDDDPFCALFIDDTFYADGYFEAGNVSHFIIDNMTSPGQWFTWYIVCHDGLNNYYTDNYTFYLDIFIADPVFNPSNFSTELTEIEVNFEVEFIESVIINNAEFNGSVVTLTPSNNNKTWTYTATVPSGESYTFDITATDSVGHLDSWDHIYTITYNAPPTPPPPNPPTGGGGGGGGQYSGYETSLNPTTSGDCAYNWVCDEWGECIDGKQIRICLDYGNCKGDKDKPIEEQDCTVETPVLEDTTGQGVGFAAGLFNRLKENWWIIPIIGALLAVLAYFGFGKYGTKIKIKQRLKNKEPINI
jgi:hypothetical protein